MTVGHNLAAGFQFKNLGRSQGKKQHLGIGQCLKSLGFPLVETVEGFLGGKARELAVMSQAAPPGVMEKEAALLFPGGEKPGQADRIVGDARWIEADRKQGVFEPLSYPFGKARTEGQDRCSQGDGLFTGIEFHRCRELHGWVGIV